MPVIEEIVEEENKESSSPSLTIHVTAKLIDKVLEHSSPCPCLPKFLLNNATATNSQDRYTLDSLSDEDKAKRKVICDHCPTIFPFNSPDHKMSHCYFRCNRQDRMHYRILFFCSSDCHSSWNISLLKSMYTTSSLKPTSICSDVLRLRSGNKWMRTYSL